MKSILNTTLTEISQALSIEKNRAKQIKRLITGKIEPENFPNTKKWINRCYNAPSKNEQILEAINEVMEGYGTGACFSEDYSMSWPLFSYINMGDTYGLSIIYLAKESKYIISTWGDMVEYYEGKRYHFK